MPPEATIRDVAKKASVSVATVSRVLNNSPSVRETTRQRVLEAIDDLSYSPNLIARSLSLGRTNTIAVVLPLFTLPSYVERLRGVQQTLAHTEYDLVLYSVETPQQRDAYFAMLASPTRVDGLLLVSLVPSEEYDTQLLASGVPTVLIDALHPDFSRVVVNDEDGGYMATRHLLELGHRRIAYLSDYLDTPFYQSMRHRFEGYRRALKEFGADFRDEYHVADRHGRAEARALARHLLTLPEPPTAIFAASDTQAIGVMDAAFSMGIHVPNELSVIGFDDIRDAEYVNLTTIRQPLFESGVHGAQKLLSLLGSTIEDGPHVKTLPLELIVRRTTAPPVDK